MYASLKRLAEEAPVTEGFEETLKRNALARSCRSYVAELARFLYPKEARVLLDWLLCTEKANRADADFTNVHTDLEKEFMETPLSEMQKPPRFGFAEILLQASKVIKEASL